MSCCSVNLQSGVCCINVHAENARALCKDALDIYGIIAHDVSNLESCTLCKL